MPGKRMRAEAKMVEIPTCSVVECRVWSVEAGGTSNMQPPFFISHFSFFIFHFSFFISHFSFKIHAGQRLPADTTAMIGESWQSCLSTDRRRADFPDLTPTQPGRLHASPHCRFVKLSGLGRKASESIKSEIIPSLFPVPEHTQGRGFFITPSPPHGTNIFAIPLLPFADLFVSSRSLLYHLNRLQIL